MKKFNTLWICIFMAGFIPVLGSGRIGDNNKPSSKYYKIKSGLKTSDYLPTTILFKVQPSFRNFCHADYLELPLINNVLNSLGQVSLHKMFPNAQPPATLKNEHGFEYADLSLIYEFTYNGNLALEKAINSLISTGQLLYAEPKFIPVVNYTPNDPDINQQYFLAKIQAYNAWNISKGDTTIVIGITDTGTDTNHPDLASNIKHNYADPVNGIDDDGDTYVDNFSGWDLGENDNDPSVGFCGTCSHGSHVSGCADAVTDNGVGVASPGFHSKFLPVKIADANGSLTKAYEGITYAADHGCQIINCSWGSAGGGQVGQDVLTYASINKNALVVVAAGNNSSDMDYYPASYKYSFAVAATDDQDIKAGFSNYGYFVDVCAPGVNIYSTLWNNTYAPSSGTSMASPVTAGAAAIVKSFYPSYNGLQVGEQLRATADNIDAVQTNTSYYNKLGKGRINLFRALSESHPSVRMENMVFTDNNDNNFIIGDTVNIAGDIINYLAPTGSIVATISTTSSYVTIVDNSTTAGVLGTMAIYNNAPDPFKVQILPSAPVNTSILFRIDITDGTYSTFQYFKITVNVDYINVTINTISTTVTSKGRIGYNDPAQTEGLGFAYNGTALMYEAGLMIGNNSNTVSDMVRGDPNVENDFKSVQAVHPILPTVKSEEDLTGFFNDNFSVAPLPVQVSHNFYVWSTPGNTKYVIYEYNIKNVGNSALGSLYAGIYADFDVGTAAENIGNTDLATKMGYTYNTSSGGLYAGIKVLSPTPFIHFATDNDGGNGGISNYDGFTTAEKYQTLSTNHLTAGGTGIGADVSNIVSTGPFSINPNDFVTVAFAMIAGDDLNDLITSANNAQIKYDGLTAINENTATANDLMISSIFPNPVSESATLSVLTSKQCSVSLQLVDALGRVVYSMNDTSLKAGKNMLSIDTKPFENGIYSCVISSNGTSHIKKITVVH